MSAPTCGSCANHVWNQMRGHSCVIETGGSDIITGQPLGTTRSCAYERATPWFFNKDRCGPTGKRWVAAVRPGPPKQTTAARKS